jgi:hypothetical protein
MPNFYEDFFRNLLKDKKSCGMIGRAWIRPAVGTRMQRRRLPLGLLSAKPRLCPVNAGKRIYPPERRKEANTWKTHFLAVANVVKVIWFRCRISVARELPLSTKHGFAPIPHACTTSKSVTEISSSMSPLVMVHYTLIAADNKSARIHQPRLQGAGAV